MSFSRELKARTAKVWEAGYNHPFVQELGAGTLPREAFKFYLLQDYLYLLEYAKVFALAAVKADTEEQMARLIAASHYILAGEMDVHRGYMADFGVTQDELRALKPSLYNRTYTANMLAHGLTGGLAEALAAVFPCGWTYADYATRLRKQYADKLEGNFYRTWIENYASAEFAASFEWFFDALDGLVANMDEAGRERIADIFASSVEFEYLFWDMSYKRQMSF